MVLILINPAPFLLQHAPCSLLETWHESNAWQTWLLGRFGRRRVKASRSLAVIAEGRLTSFNFAVNAFYDVVFCRLTRSPFRV